MAFANRAVSKASSRRSSSAKVTKSAKPKAPVASKFNSKLKAMFFSAAKKKAASGKKAAPIKKVAAAKTALAKTKVKAKVEVKAPAKKTVVVAKAAPQKAPAKAAALPPVSAKGLPAKGKGVSAKTPSKASALSEAKAGAQAGKAAAAAIAKVSAKLSGRPMMDASSETVCREVACEGLSTSAGYCRMHYIKNWKKIQRKALILKEGKLNQYIEELVSKYPDKYIEAIRQDLANDKDFNKVIHDLDLDEGIDDFEGEGDSTELIDNIKREFEDEGETF